MSSLPGAVIFINGDISTPAVPPPNPPDLDVFAGSQPNLPQSDASVSELTNIQIQLFINDTMSKAEFDARVLAMPEYPIVIKLRNLRILVVLPTFYDMKNRDLCDICAFFSHGLVNVECNKLAWPGLGYPTTNCYPNQFTTLNGAGQSPLPEYPRERHHGVAAGPPGQCYDIQRFTIYSLLNAAKKGNECYLPFGVGMECCNVCGSNYWCDKQHSFSGMKVCQCGYECKCMCSFGYVYDDIGRRISPIHLKNCDNEANNKAFIFRK